MNLLITPALRLNLQQREMLEKEHNLYYIEDERVPLQEQKFAFDPTIIEGIVCNFYFCHNPLSSLPNLRFIQLTSAGLDRVPLEQIRKKNIHLFNAGAAYAVPMAEFALCKILELYKHTRSFYTAQEQCCWQKNREILELSGRTAAILGFGNVGRQIAKRLKAFDVNIVAVDIIQDQSGMADQWFPITNLKDALKQADIIVLCLPLTPQTRHILNMKTLDCVKMDAILVNVARGGLVDTQALLNSLDSGRLLGAALDVFEEEPLADDSLLWKHPRLLITPHNSFVGEHNSTRLFEQLLKNLL